MYSNTYCESQKLSYLLSACTHACGQSKANKSRDKKSGSLSISCTHAYLASSSHSEESSEIQGLEGSDGVRKGSYSTYCSVYPSKLSTDSTKKYERALRI